MTEPRLSQSDVSKAFNAPAEFLGRGTFGDTWCVGGRAEKVLCGEPVDDDRFEREIEALSRLDHPRIVKLHGVREIEIGDSTYRVMSFEYVAGGDASNAIASGRTASGDEVKALLVGLLEAVDALHAVRVLHRDVKPANVILRDGSWSDPVLCDLGLARLVDASSITRYPAQVGTMAYMAPEQLRGKRATKGGDLWSVGVSIREAIGGRHPYFNPGDAITDRSFDAGPRSLPDGVEASVRAVLGDLTSVERYRRGTARSNLRRLESEVSR